MSQERKSAKPVIVLEKVWKTYQMGTVKVHALRGLDLSIGSHEFISIQGPSGSGKSTAVNLIGCLDIPTDGRILLDGYNIAELEESDLAQIRGKKIGFVFQKFNLLGSLSALENVLLPTTFIDVDQDKMRARAMMLLERVGLGDRAHHLPNQLSGGQQQRVAIARALINDPDVILADEPTGNLDSKMGKVVMNILYQLHAKEGKTIILVTHDDVLSHFADRIATLKDGQIESIRKSDKSKIKHFIQEMKKEVAKGNIDGPSDEPPKVEKKEKKSKPSRAEHMPHHKPAVKKPTIAKRPSRIPSMVARKLGGGQPGHRRRARQR